MERSNYVMMFIIAFVLICTHVVIEKRTDDMERWDHSQLLYRKELEFKKKADSLKMYKNAFEELSKQHVKNIDSLVFIINKTSKKKITVDSAMLWIERYNSQR